MPAVMNACPACGAPAPDLARFCPRCGSPAPPEALPSVARGLHTRWQATVQDAPLGNLLPLGSFVVCLGKGGMLHVFHESKASPELVRRLPDGEYQTFAGLLDGVLVAASSKALVAVDLVPALARRRVAVPRDRRHPLPGPPISPVATDGSRYAAVACSVGGRTEIHLFEAEPRKGLEPRKVFTAPQAGLWHLWIAHGQLLAGPQGGHIRSWSLATGLPGAELPVQGGLGGLRMQRADQPVALAADESLLLLQPSGTRLLYRPDKGTVWTWTLQGQELYACVDRTVIRVATDSAATGSLELPGQGYCVLPPARVAEGALVVTQDGYMSLVSPEAGALRLRQGQRVPDLAGASTTGPVSTGRTIFLWIPGTGLRAMEPAP